MEDIIEQVKAIIEGKMPLAEEEKAEFILNLLLSSYTLVTFPEVQIYMEESWFEDEAFLEIEGKSGNSSYFIPTIYIKIIN